METRKTHNDVAAICRDALADKGLDLGQLPIVPWDKIIYTFAQGMAGTTLDKERIENSFVACVRTDERFQALLTPQERKLVARQA